MLLVSRPLSVSYGLLMCECMQPPKVFEPSLKLLPNGRWLGKVLLAFGTTIECQFKTRPEAEAYLVYLKERVLWT